MKRYLYWPLLFAVVLFLLNIAAFFIDKRVGGIFAIFFVLYVAVATGVYCYTKAEFLRECITFAAEYGSVQKHLLEELKLPHALLDATGRILWMNHRFEEVTGKKKNYRKSVTTIFPAITRELLEKDQEETELELSYNGQIYRATLTKLRFEVTRKNNALVEVEPEEEYLTALYLFDETLLHEIRKEKEEEQQICGLIYIDNYEEALQSGEEVKRSLLIALVDRKVNKYFSKYDGIITKTERDKYFLVFRKKFLPDLLEDRFSVIDDVKTIKVGNEMAVTLSIGVGIGKEGYLQDYAYARAAIDLALGRGGDQVVIKEGENLTYYGGKSRQLEKNTRVKARVKAHALREILESRERVFIMGHAIADVDSFGAAVGIYCAARHLGKEAHIVLNEVTSSLRPFKELFSEENGYPADLFLNSDQAYDLVDDSCVVMVVDTNRPENTECPALLRETESVVVFDHHRQSSSVIDNASLSYVESYASSTCEMVAEVLQYFSENIHLKQQEVDALYAGILIDTDNFNTRTGVRTFEAAAYLRRCGAEVTRVRKLLRDDIAAYKARARVVESARVYREKFALSYCNGEGVESPTIVGAQAANELLNVVGIKASFVLTAYNGKIYVSARSIDEINVQLIMEKLGGGGHMNMAGAQLVNCEPEEGISLIQRTLDQMIEEGEIKL